MSVAHSCVVSIAYQRRRNHIALVIKRSMNQISLDVLALPSFVPLQQGREYGIRKLVGAENICDCVANLGGRTIRRVRHVHEMKLLIAWIVRSKAALFRNYSDVWGNPVTDA